MSWDGFARLSRQGEGLIVFFKNGTELLEVLGTTAGSQFEGGIRIPLKGEHPERHLQKFGGTLQADAYAGFNQPYEDGHIQQAACWAHVRRKFYDLEQAHASPVAREAAAADQGLVQSKNRFAADTCSSRLSRLCGHGVSAIFEPLSIACMMQ